MFGRTKAKIAFRSDWVLLAVVSVFVVVSLVMVYSATYHFAFYQSEGVGDPAYNLKRQLVFVLIGLFAMLVLSNLDYRLYTRQAIRILAATFVILIVMAVLGRWLGGYLGDLQSGQPTELAKIGAIIYIAVWLADRGDQIRTLNFGLIPFSLLSGAMAGLIILQPNYSTALLLIATASVMVFVAGADIRQFLLISLLGAVILLLIAFAAQYRTDRLRLWFRSPFSDPHDQGFQSIQVLAALNGGGWLGLGLGQSQQKLHIFAHHTDGMFAIICEELGIFGALFIFVLYGLLIWRGLRIAWRAPDTCGRLLAVGLVSWVTFQAALHIGVVTASTPFTGTVLPFISYGGSSMVTGLMAVGILLSISRAEHTERQERRT